MAEKFERCWAIVELFGHQQIAGEISEQTIAGGSFLRVDVPGSEGEEGFTRFFGASAVYSITPVMEEVGRAATARLAVRPVTVWGLNLRQLPKPGESSELTLDEETVDQDLIFETAIA